MSEDRGTPPTSAAEAMYPHLSGNASSENAALGEAGLDTARRMQQSGIARPDPNGPPARGPEQPWDSARYQPPEGYTVHEPTMREFSQLVNDFGLTQRQAERALQFHQKITEGDDKARRDQLEQTWNSWHAATQRELGHQLPEMVDDIRNAVGSDRDASRFFELLSWSGIEHDPSVLRVLHRLSNGGRGRW
jgi:hypothetical protein